jgi:very-short-patch-repair endonuclease
VCPNLSCTTRCSKLDGAIHATHDVRERDLPRQNDLVLLGWTVLRFTWDRVTNRPEAVVAEIRAALAAATSQSVR